MNHLIWWMWLQFDTGLVTNHRLGLSPEMINPIAVTKKISWYSVGIKQPMKYQGIVAMISHLFKQANRLFSSSESNFSHNHQLNFNQIALTLSIFMYGLSFIYLASFLGGDILKNMPETNSSNSLIYRLKIQ
jgi:hypothetical protein